MDEHHVRSSTNLGFKTNQASTNIETVVWWRAGWILQLHTSAPREPVVLRLGGYALPLPAPHVLRSDPGPILSAWTGDERGTVLQPLSPLRVTTEWDTRLDHEKPRARVTAPNHVTPVARTARLTGSGFLAALAWSGTDRAESAPEQIVRAESAPWQIVRAAAAPWQLTHPKLGPWAIAHESRPSLG